VGSTTRGGRKGIGSQDDDAFERIHSSSPLIYFSRRKFQLWRIDHHQEEPRVHRLEVNSNLRTEEDKTLRSSLNNTSNSSISSCNNNSNNSSNNNNSNHKLDHLQQYLPSMSTLRGTRLRSKRTRWKRLKLPNSNSNTITRKWYKKLSNATRGKFHVFRDAIDVFTHSLTHSLSLLCVDAQNWRNVSRRTLHSLTIERFDNYNN